MTTKTCHSEKTALAYRQAGLCVLPANREQKRPAVASWKQYRTRLPTEDELRAWFREDRPMCIIAGPISGHNEMLDFDAGGELFERWAQLVRAEAPGLLERLVMERTQNGGVHVSYRCQTPICGNMKLAMRAIEAPDDQPITYQGKSYVPRKLGDRYIVLVALIETRGDGGLYLCDPTPGYELFQGRFESLPILTKQEREILLEAAWSLNEYVPEAINPLPASTGLPDELRPGDDFNTRGDVRELLQRHGWTLVRAGDNEYWRRPGKIVGWSATFKDRVLYVFSSNAAPFEQNRAYAPFTVYALLEHGGDFARAAMELSRQGFGHARPAGPEVDLSQFKPPGAHAATDIELPSIWELINQYPKLRDPVIHGLLRRGETMNIIAAPKTGKSWLVNALALAMTTGSKWLDTFQCERGNVLILDNELHPETTAHRIPKVADALGLLVGDYGDRIFVQNMRGQLRDVFSLASLFSSIEPDRFRVIILDAFYRFMPRDMDENDNGTMAGIYNVLDQYAQRLGCCFVLIHHSTKGNQSAKLVTDVGAGAGSQSRAADVHVVLRAHEEPHAVVLEAVVRSWPPIEPMSLRWKFPLWHTAPDLDPTMLRSEKPKTRRPKERDEAASEPSNANAYQWTVQGFAQAFISGTPTSRDIILQNANEAGLSDYKAGRLLRRAESLGLVHRWDSGRNRPSLFANVPQPGGEA